MSNIPSKVMQALYPAPGEQIMTYTYVDKCTTYQGADYGTGYLVVTNMRVAYLAVSTDAFSTAYRLILNMPYEQITQVSQTYDQYRKFLVVSGYYFQMSNPAPFFQYIDQIWKSRAPPPPSQ